jgi:hypothetical protein
VSATAGLVGCDFGFVRLSTHRCPRGLHTILERLASFVSVCCSRAGAGLSCLGCQPAQLAHPSLLLRALGVLCVRYLSVFVHLGWTKHSFIRHLALPCQLACSKAAGRGSDPDAAMQRIGNPPLHCTARVFARSQGLARLLNRQLLVPWLSHTAGMHGFSKGVACVVGLTEPLRSGWMAASATPCAACGGGHVGRPCLKWCGSRGAEQEPMAQSACAKPAFVRGWGSLLCSSTLVMLVFSRCAVSGQTRTLCGAGVQHLQLPWIRIRVDHVCVCVSVC